MPRNGSGIFTLVASYFATAGQTIRTEQHNPPLEDIATALTNSLPRDGQGAMTGNLPMGGRKITNLAAGTAASDAARIDQLPAVVVQSGPYDATAGRLLTPGAFGLGLLGDAVLSTDIDATDTASGTQRYIGGAAGTFPAGITAGAGGRVSITRGTFTAGSEFLQPNTVDALFWRRLATTWQPWMQVVSVLDSTVADGDTIARISGVWARVAKGTAGQVYRQNDALTAPEWSDAIVTRAAQATTSGTVFDFTGIPAWVKRVTVICNGNSLTGSDNFLVQLGVAAGFVVTGYTSGSFVSTGGGGSYSAATAGFIIATNSAGELHSGHLVLTRVGTTNDWVSSHTLGTAARMASGGGTISLAGPLTQIRLTRDGANTFDAGSVSIIYE